MNSTPTLAEAHMSALLQRTAPPTMHLVQGSPSAVAASIARLADDGWRFVARPHRVGPDAWRVWGRPPED